MHRCHLLCSLVLMILLAPSAVSAAKSRQPGVDNLIEPVTVFELEDSPQGRYGFRIPSLVVSETGTLIAFCERRVGLHDHAQNDIVVRRSRDGGKSWTAMQVVAEQGGDSLNDPCAVVLDTGRILLRHSRFPKGVHARNSDHTVMADPGYGKPTNMRVYLQHSDDDGETWSRPRDVTRLMRREDAIAIGSPGVGLQLTRGPKRGRILFPNYEVYRIGENGRTKVISVSLSDDGGKTWQLSGPLSEDLDGFGDEAQMAELSEGGVLLSARHGPDHHSRIVSTSRDSGDSWSTLCIADDLLTPPCMASVIRYSWPSAEQAGVLLHSLPRTKDSRSNGTIMISRDEGQSWKRAKVIVRGDFAYSCLARLADGDVGCLYETEDYHKMMFLRLSPEMFLAQ